MADPFSIITDVIKNRRSIKPVKMNGQKIPDERVMELLQLANWAPTHGNTEPWKFIVYAGNKVKEFCYRHAELYKSSTPVQTFEQAKYDKQLHNGDMASHIIIAVMKRGTSPKIPALEEIAATAAAVQNILLGATAAGLASFWSTGGMAHSPVMKNFLGLNQDDVVLGIIYLGYSGEPLGGKRQTGIEAKLVWQKGTGPAGDVPQ